MSIGGGHTGSNNRFQGKLVVEINRSVQARSGTSVTDGQWHHVAITYDGLVESVYVDGARQRHMTNGTGSIPPNSYDLTIGMNLVDPNPKYNEVDASFDGLMDEPMIFNRALSPNEVKFLFESQRK